MFSTSFLGMNGRIPCCLHIVEIIQVLILCKLQIKSCIVFFFRAPDEHLFLVVNSCFRKIEFKMSLMVDRR